MKSGIHLINIKQMLLVLLLLYTRFAVGQSVFPGGNPGYPSPGICTFSDVATPQASSLGKYGDLPVSYFIGSPTISIPLFRMTVRGVTLPMTLDYDAAGVMPNSLPSPAGQNWTLNIGGVITRTVRGRYDEWTYPKQSNLPNTKNYFQCHSMLKSLMSKSDNYASLKKELMYNNYDFAPDEYNFHFMGKSGRFFMDDTGNWRVQSDDNLEVLFDVNDQSNFTSPLFKTYPYKQAYDPEQPKTIYGFTIRDTDGNRYVFGYEQSAIEYTTNFWNMSVNEDNESWHAMSWYLTKVLDKYNNELFRFEYNRSYYIIQVFNCYYRYTVKEKVTGLLGASFGYDIDNSYFPYTFSISSPVYLYKVYSDNGLMATVSSSPVSKEMSSNQLYGSLYSRYGGVNGLYDKLVGMVEKMTGTYKIGAFYYLQSDDAKARKYCYGTVNGNICDILGKSHMLKYNYVEITPTKSKRKNEGIKFILSQSYVSHRLRLDSLKMSDHYNRTSGVYRFRYNQFERLPSDYLTSEVDHWGFFNGRAYAKNGLPAGDLYTLRQPNAAYARIGTLCEIQYPTGGVCRLDYEPNTYGQKLTVDRQGMLNETGICGGLRIRSMKTYESLDSLKLLKDREFTYDDPSTGVSSGELLAMPIYQWKDWRLRCEQSNATYHISSTQTSSVVPLVNSSVTSVGYSYVTETVRSLDDSSKCIRKTVYHYSNLSAPNAKDGKFTLTFGYPDETTPYDEYSDKGFMRGKLLSEETFDGTGRKVRTVTYKYRSDTALDKDRVLTSNLLYECSGNSAQYAHYTGGVYSLYYPKYDIVELRDSVWETKDGLSVTTHSYSRHDIEYTSEYPYRHNVKLRLTDSETTGNGASSERNVYNFMDFNDNNIAVNRLYKKMFYIYPENVIYQRNGRTVSSIRTTYRAYTVNSVETLVPYTVLRKNYFGQTDTLVTYHSYTSTGAPSCYKEIGKPVTYICWALHDNFLVLTGNDVITITISDDDVYDSDKSIGLIKDFISRQSGIYTGYVYHPLYGLTAIVSPSCKVTRYCYDVYGRLSGIRDTKNRLKESYRYNFRK